MKKTQHNSCGCQAVNEKSNAACNERASFCDDGGYACDKFSNPEWIKINIDYFPAGFEAPNGAFVNVTPKDTYKMLHKDDRDYIILDVKTEREYLQRHLPDSLNIDFFSPCFKDDLFCLDKDKYYVVICKIGMRSEITMNLMKKMGFKQVYNVVGGDDRWIAEEIPYGHEEFCTADVSTSVSA